MNLPGHWSTSIFLSIPLGTNINGIDGIVDGRPGVRETQVLDRVYTISQCQDECFYLRLLLHNVKGPQSFADLRIVNGESCNSFREACLKAGLLKDHNQHHLAMLRQQ